MEVAIDGYRDRCIAESIISYSGGSQVDTDGG